MLTAAPAPNSTIPSGDVMARATRGVKKRSRNEAIQKLLITAVNTWLMVAGLLAS